MNIVVTNHQNKTSYNEQMDNLIVEVVNVIVDLEQINDNTEVSITLVDNEYMQELNYTYRGINASTDVLSFALNDVIEGEPEVHSCDELELLGDIFISLEQAEEQRKDYGHSIERELGFLVAHGMLHLLGYDHENEEERKTMRVREDQIMQIVKLER